jgi:CDP-paratose 2-epimerase
MPKNILVTGGAGFVGSNLCLYFKQDFPHARVIAFDNLKRRGAELNLSRLNRAGVKFIHGDIRNKEDFAQLDDADLMIECSAEPSVSAGYNGSSEYVVNTNLMGTSNCLEFARAKKSDVIFLSTSRVYPIAAISKLKLIESKSRFEPERNQGIKGFSQKGISERFTLEGYRTLYGATKLASELLMAEFEHMYGLRVIINRCGVLTGPWQMGKVDQGFVVLWIARHIYQGKLDYLGYGGLGKQVRDILHIGDLHELLRLQIQDIDSHSGQIYNVGGGNFSSVSLLEMTALCQKTTGNAIDIKSVGKNREGDIPYYISDCTKIKAATGWEPKMRPADIVEDITEWVLHNKESLRPVLS